MAQSDLEKLTLEQQRRLLRLYQRQEGRIKTKLKQAIEEQRSKTYLENLELDISKEIDKLKAGHEKYTQLNLFDINEKAQKKVTVDVEKIAGSIAPKYAGVFNRINRRAMAVLAENTYQRLNQITDVMGRQTDDFLRRAGLDAASDIVTGQITYQDAAKEMLADLQKNSFFHVEYKNGTKMPAKAYTRMVARTTSAEAYRKGTETRINSYGYDLVDVVGRSNYPPSPCIPYEGKTLSISGKTEGYTSLADARSNGYNHPNCIHAEVFSEKNLEMEPEPIEPDTTELRKQEKELAERKKEEEEKKIKEAHNFLQKNHPGYADAFKEVGTLKNLKKDFPGVPKEGLAALRYYTANGYRFVNNPLLGLSEKDEGFESLNYLLKNALEKIPNYEGTVYRGQDKLSKEQVEKLKSKNKFTFPAFTSTSKTKEDSFSYQPLSFIIKGKSGKSIEKVSYHPGEKEILFLPKTEFKVVSIDHDNSSGKDGLKIELEEL